MKRFSRSEVESAWSGFGTYLIICAIAWMSGGFHELWATVQDFFLGRPEALILEERTLLHAVPLATAFLVIDLPLAILVAWIVHSLPKVHVDRLTRSMAISQSSYWSHFQIGEERVDDGKQVFSIFFSVIFLEEAFARWLFLGLAWTGVEFLPNPTVRVVCFYLLFLLGNGLWALAHLGNYERRYGRSVLWVLPQFVGGISLTILYWRYGFWAALLTHFAYDAMIWCIEKRQSFDKVDILHLAASAGYAIAGYLLLGKNSMEMVLWMNGSNGETLTGWTFWDFVQICLYYQGVAGVIFGVLLYDQSGSEQQSSTNSSLKGGCGTIIGCYLLFAILQTIAGSASIAILLFSLLKTYGVKDTSMSAMCRTFWTSVPFAGIILCALQTLSFMEAFFFLLAVTILLFPITLLEHLARDR